MAHLVVVGAHECLAVVVLAVDVRGCQVVGSWSFARAVPQLLQVVGRLPLVMPRYHFDLVVQRWRLLQFHQHFIALSDVHVLTRTESRHLQQALRLFASNVHRALVLVNYWFVIVHELGARVNRELDLAGLDPFEDAVFLRRVGHAPKVFVTQSSGPLPLHPLRHGKRRIVVWFNIHLLVLD